MQLFIVKNSCLDVHITLFAGGVVFKWNGQGPSVHCKRRARKFMKSSKTFPQNNQQKITYRASTVVHGYKFWQCGLTKNESMFRLESTSRYIEIHVWVCVDLHVQVSDLQSWVLVLTYMYSPCLTYKSMCCLTCMSRCFDLHVKTHMYESMFWLTWMNPLLNLQV